MKATRAQFPGSDAMVFPAIFSVAFTCVVSKFHLKMDNWPPNYWSADSIPTAGVARPPRSLGSTVMPTKRIVDLAAEARF
jgi:hypothetical protein